MAASFCGGRKKEAAMEHGAFTFERLDVYRVACEALAVGIARRDELKGLPGELRSQLERALVSTVANIAEGAGRESRADQERHYAIARGSANEAGAVIAIAELYGLHHAEMRAKLLRVVQMLNAMIR